MKKLKEEKGITLIALIITIVVLLILAVVAIGAANDSDIVGYAQNAADSYETEKGKENETIIDIEKLLDKYQSTTNKDKAIGTDGQPVNMDYWKYVIIDEKAKTVALATSDGTAASPAYIGDFTEDGQIIGTVPQYIEIAGKDGVYTVVAMSCTFRGLEKLVIAPKIPETVVYLNCVFNECTNLRKAPVIPEAVKQYGLNFIDCENLEGELVIMSKSLESFDISTAIGENENFTIKVPQNSQSLQLVETAASGCPNYKVKVETF